MAEISVNGVSKSFEQDRLVLDNVSFPVEPGERVGLLGGNGSGKTTLLKIITGELAADRGSATIAKGHRLGYVAQFNSYQSGESVEDVLRGAYADLLEMSAAMERFYPRLGESREIDEQYERLVNRFEAAGGYDWETELNKIANGLGIDADMRARPFAALSGGEQTRICLARLIMERTDVLLLDEPTNHLDIASLEWLEDYLLHYKGTVLAVSHDRYFLDAVVTRIVELERGKAELYSGNYSYYTVEKQLRYEQQLQQYEREQAKIHQLEFTITRLKAWGSVYDNPALHKKAAAMERRVERIRQTDKPTKDTRLSMCFSSEAFRSDVVLEIDGLTKAYDGRTLFADLSARILGGGERVALLGGNGAGKTTLLRILLGAERADAGAFRFGPAVRVAYLPQVVAFDHPERTLYDTLLYEINASPQEARDRLAAFRFKGEDAFKTVSQLSGGERARLRLCMLMAGRANLLILDEPTNHLDLASREWIEEAVEGFEGTLLFVSHDRYFIKRFAQRVWELDNGAFRDIDGDYERYRRVKEMEAIPTEKERGAPRAPKPEPARKPGGGKNARKATVLEGDIKRKERELDELKIEMDRCASDYVRLVDLTEQKDALDAELLRLYAEWEALA